MVPLIVFGFGELIRLSTTLRSQKAGPMTEDNNDGDENDNHGGHKDDDYMKVHAYCILHTPKPQKLRNEDTRSPKLNV